MDSYKEEKECRQRDVAILGCDGVSHLKEGHCFHCCHCCFSGNSNCRELRLQSDAAADEDEAALKEAPTSRFVIVVRSTIIPDLDDTSCSRS